MAWIEKVTPEAMAAACVKSDLVKPLTMFKALRMQMDQLGIALDYKVNGLSSIPQIVSANQNLLPSGS